MEFVQPGEGMILDGIVTSILFKGVHYEMKVQAKGFEWLAHSTIAYQPGTEIGLDAKPGKYPDYAQTGVFRTGGDQKE